MSNFDFTTFPIIETPRLRLREITHADVPDIFAVYSNVETMRYYDTPYANIEQSHDDVQLHKRRFREKTGIRWAITLKGDDTFIGNCGFNPRIYGNHSDIGYILSRDHWRKGIMYEAVSAILPFGFNELALNRIEAWIFPGNDASSRLAEKLGFTYEGLLRGYMFGQDILMYSLLKNEVELNA